MKPHQLILEYTSHTVVLKRGRECVSRVQLTLELRDERLTFLWDSEQAATFETLSE